MSDRRLYGHGLDRFASVFPSERSRNWLLGVFALILAAIALIVASFVTVEMHLSSGESVDDADGERDVDPSV